MKIILRNRFILLEMHIYGVFVLFEIERLPRKRRPRLIFDLKNEMAGDNLRNICGNRFENLLKKSRVSFNRYFPCDVKMFQEELEI